MRDSRHFLCLTLFALITLFSPACSGIETEPEPSGHMAPRFPGYLVEPRTVEDVMPYARAYVRNKAGFQGFGLGIVENGEEVAIVVPENAEDLIIEAIERALTERDIKVHILRDFELVGVSREDARALREARVGYTSEDGYMEVAGWLEGGYSAFADGDAVKAWLQERRPDLYQKLFPPREDLSDHLKREQLKFKRENIGRAIREYLQQHPQLRGVFWGRGGSTYLKRALHPLEHKHLGVFTAHNRWEIMSEISSYPADVWQLTEDLSIEALAYVDEIHVTDPEGTDIRSKLEPVLSERWSKGAYHRGHLFMFPPQATGRFGYDVVNYPAINNEWLPPEPMALIDGVIAGTINHTGFFPHWELHFKDGYLTEVKGGGLYGELLREFMNYPNIHEATYPYYEHKGYWYLHELAWGTNPKYFRNPSYMMAGSVIPERMRAGVIHYGVGLELIHGPDSTGISREWLKFGARQNLPTLHRWHTHNYFSTYRVHLREADEWLTLMEGGHMTAMDKPEVRALASRYGDPDIILAEEWVPYVPGINAPGEYADYAADPWKVAKEEIDQIMDGTYPYLYSPPRDSRRASVSRRPTLSLE